MSIDPVMIATIVMAITSAALAVITLHYTRITSRMAQIASEAAQSARDAAEIALLQSVLSVQPRFFTKTPMAIDYIPSSALIGGEGARRRIPVETRVELSNLGAGLAVDMTARVVMFGVEFLSDATSARPTLRPGDALTIVSAPSSGARVEVARAAVAGWPDEEVGFLEVSCQDTLGSEISTVWAIAAHDGDTLALGERTVRYRLADRATELPHAPLLSTWRRLLATQPDGRGVAERAATPSPKQRS